MEREPLPAVDQRDLDRIIKEVFDRHRPASAENAYLRLLSTLLRR